MWSACAMTRFDLDRMPFEPASRRHGHALESTGLFEQVRRTRNNHDVESVRVASKKRGRLSAAIVSIAETHIVPRYRVEYLGCTSINRSGAAS
jgi:hypothetical protein